MKEISQIEKEINWHNFKIANDKLKKLSERKDLSKEILMKINILNSRNLEEFYPEDRLKIAEKALALSKEVNNQELLLETLIEKARCQQQFALFRDCLETIKEANEILEKTEQRESKESIKRKILLLYYKAISLNRLGEIDLAFEILTESKNLAEEINEKLLLMNIYYYMAINRGHAEKYNFALELGYKVKEIAQEIKHKIGESKSLNLLGGYYQWTGKYSKAQKLFEEAIGIHKMLNKKYNDLNFRIGLNYFFIGEIDKAVELFQEALDGLDKKNTSYMLRRNIHWGEGLIALKKGEIDEAIEHMIKCIDISKSIGDKYHANLNSIFLAAIYFDQGRFDLSLDITLKALENLPLSSQNYSISLAQQLLGKIHHVKGNFNLALDHAHKSLKIQTKMEVTHHLVETLLLLINIAVDKGEINLANNYLEKLEKISKENDSRYFNQTYIVGKSLILKTSSRPKNWIKAIELLEKVVTDEILNHSLTVIAMINLCELLVNEFSISGDTEVLLELEKYTETLTKIANKQNSYILKIEANNIRLLTLWLKAQFSIVEIDIQKARKLLINARDIADEEGLLRLAEKITHQHGELIKRIDNWDEFIGKYYEFLKD